MKKGTKVFIAIMCLIIVGIITFFIVYNFVIKKGGKNSSNESYVKRDERVREYVKDVENIEISAHNKLNILGYVKDFDSVDELSDGDMITAAFSGIHKGWVPLLNESQIGLDEDLGVSYPEQYVKGIIYSVFGKKIENGIPNEGSSITFKGGYYYCNWGDGDPVPEAENIKQENINGNIYYTYDVISYGNVSIYYKGEKYKVGMDSNGFVKSKKCINEKVFGDSSSFKYNKEDLSDPINAIVAILNAGEKAFVTEQKEGYFIYRDKKGKTYEIKSIDSIGVSEEFNTTRDNVMVFECEIGYTNKDGEKTNKDGYVNTFLCSVSLSNNFESCEIGDSIMNDFENEEQSGEDNAEDEEISTETGAQI